MEQSVSLTLSPTALAAVRFLKPFIFMAIGAIGLFCTSYVVLLNPVQERFSRLTITYKTVRQQYVNQQVARQTQETLQAVWAQLPRSTQFTALGVTIVQLAQRNHVQIPGMRYRLEPTADGFTTRGTIAFQASGDYEAIRRFIFELETKNPFLFIEKLSVERTKRPGYVSFTMQVSTFFQPGSSPNRANST
ncbi:MAG: hypothetical protein D6704_04580 [Nitrospirae bacterium]|nr:MAG: hypothetical protein D6704_04580 [Nitrospirota bacterium]